MSKVDVTELRQNSSARLDRVRRGERIQIASRSEVIAEISPPGVPGDVAAAARARLRDRVLRCDAHFEPVIDPEERDANR